LKCRITDSPDFTVLREISLSYKRFRFTVVQEISPDCEWQARNDPSEDFIVTKYGEKVYRSRIAKAGDDPLNPEDTSDDLPERIRRFPKLTETTVRAAWATTSATCPTG
jgi:hypothetical protein